VLFAVALLILQIAPFQIIRYIISIETRAMRVSTKSENDLDNLHQQIERIHAGLNFRAAQNLQRALQIPLDKLADVLGMSRATLHRRKIQGRLDQDESEKLVRYQRLLKRAEDVFGSPENAREWLTHRQVALGKAVPIEFAKTEIGAREVENLLGRIEYAVYS
jgi:putative toxin-antitoxin system antitoxin component (TIGR02293 family)